MPAGRTERFKVFIQQFFIYLISKNHCIREEVKLLSVPGLCGNHKREGVKRRKFNFQAFNMLRKVFKALKDFVSFNFIDVLQLCAVAVGTIIHSGLIVSLTLVRIHSGLGRKVSLKCSPN